jgi:hypothetical protein
MDPMHVALDAVRAPATSALLLSSLSTSRQEENDNVINDHQVTQMELSQDAVVAVLASPKALTSSCFCFITIYSYV